MRNANIERNTKETQISISLELDGSGKSSQDVELPFCSHVRSTCKAWVFRYWIWKATGDLEVDAHHTVEDIGITIEEAFNQALGDKKRNVLQVWPCICTS